MPSTAETSPAMTPLPPKTAKLIQKSIGWSIAWYSIPYSTVSENCLNMFKLENVISTNSMFQKRKENSSSRYSSRTSSVLNLSNNKRWPLQLHLTSLVDPALQGFNLAFQIFGGVFSCFRTFWAVCILGFGSVPLLDLGFVAYQACGFSCGSFFSLLLLLKNREYLAFINLLLPPEPKRAGKSQEQSVFDFSNSENNDSYYKLIQYLIPAVYLQSLSNSFLFIRRRNGVQYMWGLLPPNLKNWASFGLITIYEFLIPMNTWNIVLFLFLIYSSYTHYLGIHLKRWA